MKIVPTHILYLFIFAGLAFSSCNRDNEISLPEIEDGDPVFSFNAEIDGQMMEWVAGLDDQYMHTDWNLDQDDIKEFTGFLAEEDCNSDCESAIKFCLRDYDFDSNTNINESIRTKSYSYKSQELIAKESDAYRVQFESIHQEDDPDFFWAFGDFTTATGVASPIHIYERPTTGFLSPIFRLGANARAFAARQLPIFPDDGIDYNIPPVNARLEFQPLGDNKVKITLRPEGFGMIVSPDLLWDITTGLDGPNPNSEFIQTTVTADNPDHSIEIEIAEDTQIGAVVLFLDAINPLGFATVDVGLEINIDDNGIITTRGTDFDYSIEEITGGSRFAFSTFEISYTDANGKLYSSSLKSQNDNLKFEILEVSSFESNLRSQNTLRLKVKANECVLYAEDGTNIMLKDGEGVIALAY